MKFNKSEKNRRPWSGLEIGTAITLVVTIATFAYFLGGLGKEVSVTTKQLEDLRKSLSEGGVKTLQYQGTTLSAMHHRRQFQFMTPSIETWEQKRVFYAVPTNPTNLPADVQKDCGWQQVTEKRIEQFGEELIKSGFTQGWRRYPYHGQGRYRDAGWWWVITVNEDFDTERFVKFYLDFWGSPEIYLEEFSTLGDVMPAKMIPLPVIPARH